MGRNLVIVGLVLGALLGSLNTKDRRATAGADQAAQAAEMMSVASACRTTYLGLDDPTSCFAEGF
jgi:hypothetical protein